MQFHTLSPETVRIVERFEELTRIPRCSGSEAAVCSWLKKWATQMGFDSHVDEQGNLYVFVPASQSGSENATCVVLQAHLDMVPAKEEGKEFDFQTDPIPAYLTTDELFLKAEGTSLGADNGIGVALAQCLATDHNVTHGPLILLFTVDEETGFGGAKKVNFGLLRERYRRICVVNLDTEEADTACIGCAGGGNVKIVFEPRFEEISANGLKITVKGGKGGHSGVDIHHGRANANRILAQFLGEIASTQLAHLTSFHGGAAANAIPASATALIGVEPGMEQFVSQHAELTTEKLRRIFGDRDPEIEIVVEPADKVNQGISWQHTTSLARILLDLPDGVVSMCQHVPELVETSTNLGTVRTQDKKIEVVCCCRSSQDMELEGLRQEIAAAAVNDTFPYKVEFGDTYPGWAPDPSSHLLLLAKTAFWLVTRANPKELAIHAGLECGQLRLRAEQAGFSGVEIISLGPTITDVHTVNETLHVATLAVVYDILADLLSQIAGEIC